MPHGERDPDRERDDETTAFGAGARGNGSCASFIAMPA